MENPVASTFVPLSHCYISGSSTQPISTWNADAVVSLREKLKLNVLLHMGLIDKLAKAAGGFMSHYEEQAVREVSGNIERMDRVIHILLGKGDDDFLTFCKILRESSNSTWADELERMAEWFKNSGNGMYK